LKFDRSLEIFTSRAYSIVDIFDEGRSSYSGKEGKEKIFGEKQGLFFNLANAKDLTARKFPEVYCCF